MHKIEIAQKIFIIYINIMEGEPRKLTSQEQWQWAYNEASKLNSAIYEQLQRIHKKPNILSEYHALLSELWKELYAQGETQASLEKISAYHGAIGSTIFPEYFKPNESKADLDEQHSIVDFLRRKLEELKGIS